MESMIWQNWDPFKKNKREALINKNGTQTSGRWNPTNFVPTVRFFHEFCSFKMWQKHYQNKAIYWRETLKMLNLELSAEIVPTRFPSRFPSRLLLQIGTVLGRMAIFLTANALCSPVRKENPASRACGKKDADKEVSNSMLKRMVRKRFVWPPVLLA